ncbi:MAG TPA: tetratricopeptide repeat protein [Xanthobacteraceae bacterium]|nr:tetratricopeptide repeat protein [Xanthobacteraceae bacterium]
MRAAGGPAAESMSAFRTFRKRKHEACLWNQAFMTRSGHPPERREGLAEPASLGTLPRHFHIRRRKMHRSKMGLLGLTALAALAVFPPSAVADVVSDASACENQSDEIGIAACSRAIASRRYKGKDLAALYLNRSAEYNKKGDFDRAIADCNEAIRLDPKNAPAYNNRGNAYRAKGDRDHAIADYSEAIRLNPKYAFAYYNRGNAYADKGDRDRAIADYSEAIRLDPKYAFAYNGRGNAYVDKGDRERAIGDYTEAIRLDPKFALAYYARGTAYQATRDLDRAIADYDQAIRLDPKYAFAYNNRGNAHRAKGDLDRAIADYDQAIRLDPKDVLAYNNRGNAWRDKGNRDRAIADYSEAIRLDPKYAAAYNNRCWARATTGGDLQQALADCTEAVRLRPDDASAIDSRGFVYLRLDRLDDAIASYDAALKIDPRMAESMYGRGVAKLRKGDTVGGNADIAAAKAAKTTIADEFAKWGVKLEVVAATPAASPPATPPAADCARAETHWKSAEEIRTVAVYEDHLARFPNCEFAGLAKARIEALKLKK